MANNINSFTETVNNLTKDVNIALASMVGLNEAMTTEQDSVVIEVEGTDPVTGDSSLYNYSIPSFNSTQNEMARLSKTVDTFVSGQGVVLLNDGTFRQVTTIPVAKSPDSIISVQPPSKFQVRNNWFFESLMFPQLYIEFDMKGKIDDRSDRIVIRRVIFDNFDSAETQWFKTNIVGKELTYSDVTTIFQENGKNFFIDEEVQQLPLNPTKYTGGFRITDKSTIDNKTWYFLDTLNYGLTSDSSVVNNIELKINDQLRYNDSLYGINSIEVTEKRVSLTSLVGLGRPTINNSFYIYSTPFQEKNVQIPIGYNECEIIFFKGVNDDFNIIADDWSNSISFYSNYLKIDGGSLTLEDYYHNYVSDFGRQLEGQAKEKFIPAYYGLTPDAPVITSDMFAVKQLNTQMNAALDTEAIKNTQTQIESTKSVSNSLKTTISQQKAQLVELTDAGDRADLDAKIVTNTNDLSKKTIEYQSLVRSLATVAYENSAVTTDAKYRIRGFFPIPQSKGTPPQQIIQFEYAYRYLKLDNTGVALNTYQHTDPDTGQVVRGVFTDWTIIPTISKQKVYDVSTDSYSWVTENIANGEVNNINQVDIPITKGEKVELKIRSISEAGWPLNPLKSTWSNTIINEFPSNLEGSDQVTNILADAAVEEEAIKLDETLSAAGVPTHISDSVPNPLSGSGTYFKHQAVNLSYDLKTKDEGNNTTAINTTDLQSQLENLTNNTYITLSRPTGSTSTTLSITGTIQQFFQAIIDSSGAIYDRFAVIVP